MFSYQVPDSIKNYWDLPSLLLQKFPAEEFMATAKLIFRPKIINERTGLIVHGSDYGWIGLVNKEDGKHLSFAIAKDADKGKEEKRMDAQLIASDTVYLRVKVTKAAICEFSYSEDGNNFTVAGEKLKARPGRWVGAKLGLFCTRQVKNNDSGYADMDWFRIEKIIE
jgi:beta-xylosidase